MAYGCVLASGEEEVRCVALNSGLLGDGSLPKGHGDNGCHVCLVAKHKDRDTQCLAHFPHHSVQVRKLE